MIIIIRRQIDWLIDTILKLPGLDFSACEVVNGCIPSVEVLLTAVNVIISRVKLAFFDLVNKETINTTLAPFAASARWSSVVAASSRREIGNAITLSIG